MKKILLPYLYFTRAERRGAFALVLLIAGFFLWPVAYQQWYLKTKSPKPITGWEASPVQTAYQVESSSPAKKKKAYPYHNFNTTSRGIYPERPTHPPIQKHSLKPKSSNSLYTRSAFPFDPNEASESELLVLGFSKFCVKNMMRYRSKGGRYTSIEKLKSTFGMDPELLEHLAPLIQFPSKNSSTEEKNIERKKLIVDINQASEVELDQLPGIGPVLAKRIIQYRTALGGFLNIPQIGETYGLQDSVFQKMIPFMACAPGNFQYIDINTVDETTLAAHPYCSRKQASILIAYRQQHGAFADIADLDKIKLPEFEKFKRILPYLKYQ